jgi:hypothetical protein
MSHAAPATQPAPVILPPTTLGGLPVAQAGMLELIRGAGTTGVAAVALYMALRGDIDDLGKQIDDIGGRLTAVSAQVHELQLDVTRLQVAAHQPPPAR